MTPISFSQLLALVGAFALGAAAAALLSGVQSRRRLQEMHTRLDRTDKARQHANDLLLQARKQIEQLQKDLVMSRRTRPAAPAAEPRPAAPAPAKSPLLLDDDKSTGEKRTMPAHGFAETLPFMP